MGNKIKFLNMDLIVPPQLMELESQMIGPGNGSF